VEIRLAKVAWREVAATTAYESRAVQRQSSPTTRSQTNLNQDNQDSDINPQRTQRERRKTSLDRSLRACGVLCGSTICTNLTWSDLGGVGANL
jgi:hypothetical protein